MKETLQELQKRAADAGCYVEFELDAECGSSNDKEEGFTESGSFVANFKPLSKVNAPIGWGGTAERIDIENPATTSTKAIISKMKNTA